MKKWEYQVTDVSGDDDLCGVMSDLGREGWEIFHVIEGKRCIVYSKREIPEPPARRPDNMDGCETGM